jgi:hypothetical protein
VPAHLLHGRLVRVQIHLRDRGADLLFEAGDPVSQALQLPPALKDHTELIGRERLGKIVEGAAAHRLDRRGDARMGRDDHHCQARRLAQQQREQCHPLLAPQPQIEEGEVEALLAQQRERLLAGAGFAHCMSHALQRRPQCSPQACFVVDQQQVHESLS